MEPKATEEMKQNTVKSGGSSIACTDEQAEEGKALPKVQNVRC